MVLAVVLYLVFIAGIGTPLAIRNLGRKPLDSYDEITVKGNEVILTLAGEGPGCCWICSFNRKKIRDILKVTDKYNVDLVLALGYPWESPRCHDIKKGESIKYEKDTLGVLHVPKRKLGNIIHLNYF
jgi:nitroreductase